MEKLPKFKDSPAMRFFNSLIAAAAALAGPGRVKIKEYKPGDKIDIMEVFPHLDASRLSRIKK